MEFIFLESLLGAVIVFLIGMAVSTLLNLTKGTAEFKQVQKKSTEQSSVLAFFYLVIHFLLECLVNIDVK